MMLEYMKQGMAAGVWVTGLLISLVIPVGVLAAVAAIIAEEARRTRGKGDDR